MDEAPFLRASSAGKTSNSAVFFPHIPAATPL
jgi:hypothetical protein